MLWAPTLPASSLVAEVVWRSSSRCQKVCVTDTGRWSLPDRHRCLLLTEVPSKPLPRVVRCESFTLGFLPTVPKRCPDFFFFFYASDTFSFSTIRPLARSSLSPTKLLPWWSGDQAPERDLPACGEPHKAGSLEEPGWKGSLPAPRAAVGDCICAQDTFFFF